LIEYYRNTAEEKSIKALAYWTCLFRMTR